MIGLLGFRTFLSFQLASQIGQLACTRRKWCDFVSYDPRLPEHLQLVVIRVHAEDLDIAGIEQSVIRFNQKIDQIICELNPQEVAA